MMNNNIIIILLWLPDFEIVSKTNRNMSYTLYSIYAKCCIKILLLIHIYFYIFMLTMYLFIFN